MNVDQLTSDFLPKELLFKLYRDIPFGDYRQQIELVHSYAKTLKADMDPEVFDIKLHHQIGSLYWEAGVYPDAIAHLIKVMKGLAPHHHPSLYFQVIGLLIRCNRQMQEFGRAFYWAEIALNKLEATKSSFEKLNILAEYVDVLSDANEPFNKEYEPVIQDVIVDLGFPERVADSMETVNTMRATNHIWNRKLSEVELSLADLEDTNQIVRALDNFRQNCPIKWYRNYAENALNSRKGR